VDVFITPEAFPDFRAVTLLRTGGPAWGLLLGHKRGLRIFIERLFPAGAGAVPPPPGKFEELDMLFGRRVMGIYAVRPAAAFKKSLLGPYFYGRLFLNLRPSKNGAALRFYVVEFDRVFSLAPVRLEPGPKGEIHE
jgi:hypothetical protein